MINRFFLTCLSALIISFSFAQKDAVTVPQKKKITGEQQAQLKKNVAIAVNYFKEAIQLDPKQRTIFMRSFSNYVNDINTARLKSDNRKDLNAYVLRFTERRNKIIKDAIDEKKFEKYLELVKFFDPTTLMKKGRDPKITLDAVDFFTDALKLSSEQRSVFLRSLSRYINAVSSARETSKSSKDFDNTILTLSDRRNSMIQNQISSKQYKKYIQLIKSFDPKTLKRVK